MVTVKNLIIDFDNAVLKNISFEFPDDSVLLVIGRSGSGKTILMKTMLGLIEPDSGNISIMDIDINSAPKREIRKVKSNIGVLFQNNALFDSMTVYENIALPLIYNKGNRDYSEKVTQILETVHLTDISDKQIHELSGGMMKRVAIARALINEPNIIFYDEPITGLDPITSETIIELIKELSNSKKRTTIIITHDIKGFLDFADFVLMLDNGNVDFFGNKIEFMSTNNETVKKYLKSAGYV